jgi:hypothetical protein
LAVEKRVLRATPLRKIHSTRSFVFMGNVQVLFGQYACAVRILGDVGLVVHERYPVDCFLSIVALPINELEWLKIRRSYRSPAALFAME